MSIEQPSVPPFIAGLWRRFGAFILDCTLLGILGVAAGSFFVDELVTIGPWGRLLGFAVALTYFGMLNSRLANGQTIGMRLLKVRVVGADGVSLSLSRSLLRFLPLGAPWFLNNAQFSTSVLLSPWLYVLSVAVFGLGLSIIYLYFFNRRSRQSIHDLLVGSYVVPAAATGAVSTAPVWRPHFIVCALLILAAAVLPYLTKDLAASEPFASLMNTYQAVSAEPGVVYAKINKGKSYSGQNETKYMNVVAHLDAPDIDNAERAKSLAARILATDASTLTLDIVQVTLVYGYDIGIASSWRSQNYVHAPAEWAK